MPRAEKQLSAVGLKHLEPGLHHDGLGLYLQVTAKKNRSWVFRYMRDGKARYMGLGALHTVGLAKARTAAAEARQQLVAGVDPIAQRQELRATQRREAAKTITFKEASERYIAAHQAGWKNAKHGAQWTASLARYAFPTIGTLAVGDVDVGHVMKILEPIWYTKPETASRVRGRIESILDWAVARGYRKKGENPARWKGHLDKLLPARTKVRRP
ncbi:MAG: integrase arm-type DNA-binding domain-containing protein, partial [Hyphomicrobium sp.]|nr:integrase arm-type DNA-binding domain-containing protein [Hyphomicrobium sp.]